MLKLTQKEVCTRARTEHDQVNRKIDHFFGQKRADGDNPSSNESSTIHGGPEHTDG